MCVVRGAWCRHAIEHESTARRALMIERQRVLARYDVDGDGEMSPDEFILMMSHRQHDPQNEMREVQCRDACAHVSFIVANHLKGMMHMGAEGDTWCARRRPVPSLGSRTHSS